MPSNMLGWVMAGVGLTVGAALGTMILRALGTPRNG